MKVKKKNKINWLFFKIKILNKNFPTNPANGGIPANDNKPKIVDIKKNE